VDLQEAAGLLGVSTEAVRKRATRGSLHSEKRGDGRVVVWMDDDRTEGGRKAQGEASADGGSLVEVLTEQVAYLKAQLDIRTEELREHRRLLAGLIERVPELEAPKEQSGASEQPVAPETVEEEPEEAGPRSDTGGAQGGAQRSWWRRMFGS
jgi:hypothetical protein